MHKYIILRQGLNSTDNLPEQTDVNEVFNSLKVANFYAREQWERHANSFMKGVTRIMVIKVEISDNELQALKEQDYFEDFNKAKDDPKKWGALAQYSFSEECFDSDRLN